MCNHKTYSFSSLFYKMQYPTHRGKIFSSKYLSKDEEKDHNCAKERGNANFKLNAHNKRGKFMEQEINTSHIVQHG